MIKRVAFSVYPVSDMARARAFYEQVLGLKPGDDFDGKWQEYDIDGTCFAISSMIAQWIKPGSQNAVAFEVEDLGALLADLKTQGVTIDGEPMEFPPCKMAFVRDPDGNQITLHQLKD